MRVCEDLHEQRVCNRHLILMDMITSADAELARMNAVVAENAALAAEHGQESAKTWQVQ